MTLSKALIIGVEDYKDPQFKKRPGTLNALRDIDIRLQQGGWQTRFLHNTQQQLSQRSGLTQILEAFDELKHTDQSLILISTHIINRKLIPYDARHAFLEQSSIPIDSLLSEIPNNAGLLLDAMLDAESIESIEWIISAGKDHEGELKQFGSYGPSSFLHACASSLNQAPLDQTLSVQSLFKMMHTHNAPHTLCYHFSQSGAYTQLLTPTPSSSEHDSSHPSNSADSSLNYKGSLRFLANGRYQILRMLGEGGIGQVYLAYDHQLKIQRAIKVMKLLDHITEEQREQLYGRSLQAAKAAQELSEYTHNVVAVYDLGIDADQYLPYTVMEYVDGITLNHRLQKESMTLDKVFDICLQLAKTIGIAHEKNIIHRDLKPDNIMLVQRDKIDDFVKLLDFDLVKMEQSDVQTKEGQILGTLEYMSPEQLRGMEIDARVDVYAFGAILYECLSGYRANHGKNQRELIQILLDTGVTPLYQRAPHIPKPLCELVDQCLSLDPTLRPANGMEVYQALQKLQYYKAALSSVSIISWSKNEAGDTNEQTLKVQFQRQFDSSISTPSLASSHSGFRSDIKELVNQTINSSATIDSHLESEIPDDSVPDLLLKIEDKQSNKQALTFLVVTLCLVGIIIFLVQKPQEVSKVAVTPPIKTVTVKETKTQQESWSALPPRSLLPKLPSQKQNFKPKYTDSHRVYQGKTLAESLASLTYEAYFSHRSGEHLHPAWLANSIIRQTLLSRLPYTHIQKSQQSIRISHAIFDELLVNRPKLMAIEHFGEFLSFPDGLFILDISKCDHANIGAYITHIQFIIKGYTKKVCYPNRSSQECNRVFQQFYLKSKKKHEALRLNLTYHSSPSLNDINPLQPKKDRCLFK